jgi:predicted transcriptional regulator
MSHSKKLSQKGQSRIAFLPIKPIYADKIIAGEKLFEFRRTMIRKDISHLIIYSSSPVKKIIGIAKVKAIMVASPSATWERTKHAAGITRRLFREYFCGTSMSCTIEVGRVIPLDRPIPPEQIEKNFKVPQSFSYVDNNFLQKIFERGCIAKGNSRNTILS